MVVHSLSLTLSADIRHPCIYSRSTVASVYLLMSAERPRRKGQKKKEKKWDKEKERDF